MFFFSIVSDAFAGSWLRSSYPGPSATNLREIPIMPSPPTDELIQHLSAYDLKVGELALGLREIILKEAPAACETVFKSYALAIWYSFTGRMSDSLCYIGVSSNHVNLGFLRGSELPDPNGVLEGSGKQMRHIKIRRPE